MLLPLGRERFLMTELPLQPLQSSIDGLEQQTAAYRAALPLMWALAVWSLAKTLLVVLLWIGPYTLVTKRSLNLALKHSRRRWYEGPPKVASIWFDGLSLTLREIRSGSRGFRALDVIYNWRFHDPPGTLGHRLAKWWLGMRNAQAVRNRFRITKHWLAEEIRKVASSGRDVRVLSIACGSAQAVIEAVVETQAAICGSGLSIEVRLLDRDLEALEYAQALAQKRGVDRFFRYYQCTAEEFVTHACEGGAWRPDLVEMVGFLDYRSARKVVSLLARIRQQLDAGGGANHLSHKLECRGTCPPVVDPLADAVSAAARTREPRTCRWLRQRHRSSRTPSHSYHSGRQRLNRSATGVGIRKSESRLMTDTESSPSFRRMRSGA